MMALWLMLSGIYKPMLIGFGLVSVGLVMIIVRRMDQVDGDHVRIFIKPVKFIFYIFFTHIFRFIENFFIGFRNAE